MLGSRSNAPAEQVSVMTGQSRPGDRRQVRPVDRVNGSRRSRVAGSYARLLSARGLVGLAISLLRIVERAYRAAVSMWRRSNISCASAPDCAPARAVLSLQRPVARHFPRPQAEPVQGPHPRRPAPRPGCNFSVTYSSRTCAKSRSTGRRPILLRRKSTLLLTKRLR